MMYKCMTYNDVSPSPLTACN